MRSVVVACVFSFVLIGASATEARQVCLPGTGLSCGSNGGSYDPGPDVVSRNQRIAAGMDAAGALVNLLGVVLDMVDRSSSSANGGDDDYDADRDVIRRLEQGERVEECRMARAWEASGIRQLRVSDYTSAEAHFAAALQHAQNGHCDDLQESYERNISLAKAQEFMLSAIAFIGEKKYKEASNQLTQASWYASGAHERDLEKRILDYRRQLHDKIAKDTPFKERTTCIDVNGVQECD